MSDFILLLSSLPGVVWRGITVGLLAAVAASLIGVTLVLKKYSMIGDGLSHVAFGAMSISLVMGAAPLAFSLPIVVLCAFLLLRLSKKSAVGGDAAIALVSVTSLALGIAAVSLAKGVNANVNDYMFGSIVAVSKADAVLCIPITVLIIAVFILLYNKILSLTFDESFAGVSGIRVGRCNAVIALLTALTVVIGMKIMGTLLISGLIIFPALSAMRLCGSFRSVVILSAVFSVVCFILGTLCSVAFGTPVGASIVLCNAVIFGVCSLFGHRMQA